MKIVLLVCLPIHIKAPLGDTMHNNYNDMSADV